MTEEIRLVIGLVLVAWVGFFLVYLNIRKIYWIIKYSKISNKLRYSLRYIFITLVLLLISVLLYIKIMTMFLDPVILEDFNWR